MQYQIVGSLARKCKIILWFPRGADRRRADVQSGDYQNFLDG